MLPDYISKAVPNARKEILAIGALCLLVGCGAKPSGSTQESQANTPPRPDFTGRWTLAPEKSAFQIPKPTSATMSIEHRNPKFSLSRTTVFADAEYQVSAQIVGHDWNVQLVADGRPVAQKLGNGGTRVIELGWEKDELVLKLTFVAANATMVEGESRYRLSEDGRSIVVAERIGGLTNRWVFEKQ